MKNANKKIFISMKDRILAEGGLYKMVSRRAGKTDDPVIAEIRERIVDKRKATGLSQTQLAEELEKYRKRKTPQFKEYTKNDVENIENNGKEIKAQHILAVSDVLGMSCDEILKGNKAEDQNIVDDLGLSGKALVALRNRHSNAELVSFFIEHSEYLRVLQTIREYIETPNDWKKLEGEETRVNVADIRKYNIDVELRNARRDYMANKRVKTMLQNMKGEDPDGEEGER